jgi:RNA polymerase sigma factor (sigma-70 family)
MDPAPVSVWEVLAAHRASLLRIALRRASSPEAAEDAVQEALIRAATHWDVIDAEQLGAWLTVVTMNLCADEHRLRMRERRALPRLFHAPSQDPGDVVTQRLEDEWVVDQVDALPDRQRRVLHTVAAEGGVPAAARRLGVSRQSAESLLKRARANVRARIAITLGALGLGGWRRSHKAGAGAGGAIAGLAAVSLSLVATVPGMFGGSNPKSTHQPRAHATIARSAATPHSTDRSAVRRHPRAVTAPSASADDVLLTPNDRRVLMKPHDYDVGPAHYHDGGAYLTDRDHTFREEIQNCIDHGVEVSTTYIGCRKFPHA